MAWEIFCRLSDTEDLITPKEYSPSPRIERISPSVTDRNDINERIKVNVEEDNNAIDITDSSSFTNNINDKNITTLKESSRLGQYFASKENSRRVAECALEKILPLFRHQIRNGAADDDDDDDDDAGEVDCRILFIEPSCGHGDIIVALVEALKLNAIPPRSVFIQGFDVDPNAIHICNKRPELLSDSSDSSSDGDDDGDGANTNHYPIQWDCQSFFETTRQKCIDTYDAVNNNGSNNDDDQGGMEERDRNENKTTLLVCCLGGPPYTTGQGSGSNIQRDLPTQFVQHCREEWKADVVTFLLPARYREGMQHNITDCTFTTKTTTMGTTAATAKTATSSHNSCINNWICETEELKASTFFFRGTTQVTQPSIIQTFCKK